MKRIPTGRFSLSQKFSGHVDPNAKADTYADFSATELYCQKCQMPVPVTERLLLILPDGELYEYICVRCGNSVGEKTSQDREKIRIVLA